MKEENERKGGKEKKEQKKEKMREGDGFTGVEERVSFDFNVSYYSSLKLKKNSRSSIGNPTQARSGAMLPHVGTTSRA